MGSTQSQKLPTSKVPGGSASGATRGSDFLSGSPLTDLPTPPSPPARSLSTTPSGNIMRDGLASGGLKLSAPVGPGALNRPKDVFQVETVLNGSGLLNRAPGTRFGNDTASAIGQGQQRLNRDHISAVGRGPLKIDSLINPDGPTQTATRGLARQVADQWRGFEQRRNPALPISKAPKPQRPSVTPVVEIPFAADLQRLQDALSADQDAELTRLADGLSKTRMPGSIANDISDAINTDGLKAVAEFQVVRDRLAKIGTSDQVRALDFAVMQRLDPAGQKLLRDVTHTALGTGTSVTGEAAGMNDDREQNRLGGVQGRIESRKRQRAETEKKKRKKEEAKIDWNDKPAAQLGSGTRQLNVKGPLKIQLRSVTPGLDGLRYEIDWLPLDKNGNVIPEWRSSDHKAKDGGGHILFGNSIPEKHHPPYDNPYGFKVQIRIPPQPAYHGNSSGVHLNIFTAKGQPLIKEKGK